MLSYATEHLAPDERAAYRAMRVSGRGGTGDAACSARAPAIDGVRRRVTTRPSGR